MKATQMPTESHRSEHIGWLRAAVLATNVEFEPEELAQIYVGRGLEPDLAAKVAEQLMSHDALGSHARDELGITEALSARPIQGALAMAITAVIGKMFGTIV